MKIILLAGFKKDYEQSIRNMSKFIQKTYKVKHVYHAETKGIIYTRDILLDTLADPEITITPIKTLNLKYRRCDKIVGLDDVDLWDRTDKYKNAIKKMRYDADSDENIAKRMRSMYENLTSHHLNSGSDIVIIADQLIVSSIVEELYRINKYFTSKDIGCFISVINTEKNMLDVHKLCIP